MDIARPSLLRALRHRNYRLFFGGQSVSLVGTWITRVATSWLVYRLTGSALLLGVVGFCGQIPTLFLAPFAGVFVDRWDRHRVLVVTQVLSMLQSLALAALALAGTITVPAGARAADRSGCHQRLRHAGPAGVRRRDGRGPRRSPQRHRAQLVDGERAAASSGRRIGGRGDRGGGRGMVLSAGRDLLPRGDRVAGGDAPAAADPRRRRDAGARGAARGVPVRLRGSRRSRTVAAAAGAGEHHGHAVHRADAGDRAERYCTAGRTRSAS